MATGIPYGPEQTRWDETLSPLAKSPDGELLVTPPTTDPLAVTPSEGVTGHWYQVPSTGLTQEQREKAEAETAEKSWSGCPNLLGFQGNMRCMDHVDSTKQYLNNAGDPFLPEIIGSCVSRKWMERNVLDYYASLWHAKWPHDPRDPDSYWGYVLSMGSTEGNLCAVWNARDYLAGRYVSATADAPASPFSKYRYAQCKCPSDNPNALTPVAIYSRESHYSIVKCMQVMLVPTIYDLGTQKYAGQCPLGGEWPHEVPCSGGEAGHGTIDIQILATLVDFFTSKGHPVIVIFNCGTTMKGAYDDVQAAGEALLPILKRNGMFERKLYMEGDDPNAYVVRKGFWFHIDGALGAAYVPFLRMAYKNGLTNEKPPPAFDFRLGFVSSIVTSGYKWISCPWPCGIYITKTGLQLRPSDQDDKGPRHINPDICNTTFAGSRNAHSAAVLWSYISTHSYEAQVKKVLAAEETTSYTERRLRELEAEIGRNLSITRSPASLAVCFTPPRPSICEKYSLPVFGQCIEGDWRQHTHVYIMDGVTSAKIDELIEALRAPGAFCSDN